MPLRAAEPLCWNGRIIMSLNPDGAPAYTYQIGATAYLIDPAGAYTPAGASAPTTDAAGTDAGASAPTLAAAGAYIPITGATSATAKIVDPAGAYSPAGAARGRSTRPAQTVARARAPPRSPRRALLFRSQGRPPPLQRLSTPRVHTAARARERRRPILATGAAPLASARRRLRPRARTFQRPERPPRRRKLTTLPALTVWRARARRRPIRPAGTAPPVPALRRSRRRALIFR